MHKIAISSDSTCGISQTRASELGIYVMPLNVIVDEVEFHDGINIDGATLASKMRSGAKIKTSTPTLYEIEHFFADIFARGYEEIIHFTISSQLSSMFDLFTVHCEQYFGKKIHVIDSRGVSTLQESLVLSAKNLLNKGATKEEIIAVIEKNKLDYQLYFVPETLTYLKNGGRVKPAVAALGNLMGMKPVLRFLNGAIEKESTTRNYKKTILDLTAALAKLNLSPEEYELAIFYFDTSKEWLEATRHAAEKALPTFAMHESPLAINVGAHTGPGTIGVGLVRKPVH